MVELQEELPLVFVTTGGRLGATEGSIGVTRGLTSVIEGSVGMAKGLVSTTIGSIVETSGVALGFLEDVMGASATPSRGSRRLNRGRRRGRRF